MNIDIKYPIAFDSKNNIVHANDPDINIRRSAKTCCGCGEHIHYVREHLREGTTVVAHFRHSQNNPNCTINKAIEAGESKYHNDLKDKLFSCANYHIDNKIPFLIEYHCDCGEVHNYNIVEKVNLVEKEYYNEGFRPDIALIDTDKKVIIVLEIIVTHRPESDYLDHLRNHNINLLTFELDISKDFQYWVDRYIGNDGILYPSSANFIDCDNLKLKDAFSLYSRWYEDATLDFENYKKICADQIKNIFQLPLFPTLKNGKSENIRIVQSIVVDDKTFAKVQIYGTEEFFLIHIGNDLTEELRKNNIPITENLDGYIFSIIRIKGQKQNYYLLRHNLMKEDFEKLEQEFITIKEEKIGEKLKQELITKKEEKKKLKEDLDELNRQEQELIKKLEDLEESEKKFITKKEYLEESEKKFMNCRSALSSLDKYIRSSH